MSGTKNWFKKGFDNFDPTKETETYQPARFWLGRGEQASVVFLDDEPFIYKEHQVIVEDDYGKKRFYYFPCIKDIYDRCPLCETGNKRYTVGLFTIIDRREYKDRLGNIHKDTKRLFPAKLKALEILKRKKATRGGFAGREVIIFRTDVENSSATGDEFEIMGEVKDIKELPYDYEKIIVPLSVDEMLAKIKELNSYNGNESKSTDIDDIDI